MEQTSSRRRYIRLLLRWMDRIEAMLMKGLFVAFVLMIVAQLLLRIPAIREAWSKTELLEGEPLQQGETMR